MLITFQRLAISQMDAFLDAVKINELSLRKKSDFLASAFRLRR